MMDDDVNELQSLLRDAAALLRASGAEAVYVFGSVATGKNRDTSDVDLAVSGLPPGSFFETMARLGDLLDRPVDLVDLDVSSPFTAYLKEKGLLRRVA
ncbi:MAG TPA: nucleotidyltransferase domain-containing protein [Thermoanaerobaculia bacterium]|nr:nucleotidyltransferase domain-containing protein [Thermoanaerobaculia bacterium]